ncbi:uncharacterized protein TRAVEDRAFT_29382, partial [Trametes versicolor FP-101664 SS1]|uniref:uncharacterized protein n=1 Tax=Trametes versicolor (strain FP-101664) TaxID=717944 RepID=UPI0004623BCF
MDTGVVPLISQYLGKNIQSRLLQWLQHVVDYQNAFHYMEGLGFSASDCHSHDRCLPSAMLNEEGRLIVDAADFHDSNLGCFQSCLRTLYDEERGALSLGRDYANDDDVVPYASALLNQLRSHIGVDSAVQTFLQS